MRQLSTRHQMPQKLTTIGHHMTFNNEQSIICLFEAYFNLETVLMSMTAFKQWNTKIRRFGFDCQ